MKPIAFFEKYAITQTGNVVSLSTNTVLQPITNPNGYLKVSLSNNEGMKQLSVHRLVASHFIPNPYGYPVVNHLDGDKTHNYVRNLEWVSHEGNVHHALKTGLTPGYMSADDREKYLYEILQGLQVNALAVRINRRPETLHKMLRETAKRLGIHDQWTETMKENRRVAAIRNIEKYNNRDS